LNGDDRSATHDDDDDDKCGLGKKLLQVKRRRRSQQCSAQLNGESDKRLDIKADLSEKEPEVEEDTKNIDFYSSPTVDQ
jgi:hypothetical protein